MLNTKPVLGPGDSVAPLRSFRVRMDKNSFEQLTAQMQRFAAAFAFENRSRQRTPDPYDIFFVFLRNDIMLVASNDTERHETGLKYSIHLYPNFDRLASPPSPENVDVLVEGLKKILAPLEGAVVTEMPVPK